MIQTVFRGNQRFKDFPIRVLESVSVVLWSWGFSEQWALSPNVQLMEFPEFCSPWAHGFPRQTAAGTRAKMEILWQLREHESLRPTFPRFPWWAWPSGIHHAPPKTQKEPCHGCTNSNSKHPIIPITEHLSTCLWGPPISLKNQEKQHSVYAQLTPKFTWVAKTSFTESTP